MGKCFEHLCLFHEALRTSTSPHNFLLGHIVMFGAQHTVIAVTGLWGPTEQAHCASGVWKPNELATSMQQRRHACAGRIAGCAAVACSLGMDGGPRLHWAVDSLARAYSMRGFLAYTITGRRLLPIAASTRSAYRLEESSCSACCSEVSVNLAPLNMRATSCLRSVSSNCRMEVCVRPERSFFSIKKC